MLIAAALREHSPLQLKTERTERVERAKREFVWDKPDVLGHDSLCGLRFQVVVRTTEQQATTRNNPHPTPPVSPPHPPRKEKPCSIQHTAYSIQHTASYSIQHTACSIQHTAYRQRSMQHHIMQQAAQHAAACTTGSEKRSQGPGLIPGPLGSPLGTRRGGSSSGCYKSTTSWRTSRTRRTGRAWSRPSSTRL